MNRVRGIYERSTATVTHSIHTYIVHRTVSLPKPKSKEFERETDETSIHLRVVRLHWRISCGNSPFGQIKSIRSLQSNWKWKQQAKSNRTNTMLVIRLFSNEVVASTMQCTVVEPSVSVGYSVRFRIRECLRNHRLFRIWLDSDADRKFANNKIHYEWEFHSQQPGIDQFVWMEWTALKWLWRCTRCLQFLSRWLSSYFKDQSWFNSYRQEERERYDDWR